MNRFITEVLCSVIFSAEIRRTTTTAEISVRGFWENLFYLSIFLKVR